MESGTKAVLDRESCNTWVGLYLIPAACGKGCLEWITLSSIILPLSWRELSGICTETWSNVTWTAVCPLMYSTGPVHTLCWILLLGSGVVKLDDTAHHLQPKLSFTSFTALQPLCILVGQYSVTLRNTTLLVVYFYGLVLQAFGS